MVDSHRETAHQAGGDQARRAALGSAALRGRGRGRAGTAAIAKQKAPPSTGQNRLQPSSIASADSGPMMSTTPAQPLMNRQTGAVSIHCCAQVINENVSALPNKAIGALNTQKRASPKGRPTNRARRTRTRAAREPTRRNHRKRNRANSALGERKS
jgi:hypothetical protein